MTRTVRTMVVWTGVAAGILSAGAARALPTAAATQQAPGVQPPTFRAGVEAVEVDVIVTDEQGSTSKI